MGSYNQPAPDPMNRFDEMFTKIRDAGIFSSPIRRVEHVLKSIDTKLRSILSTDEIRELEQESLGRSLLDTFIARVRNVEKELKPGGPDVLYELIVAYIDDDLDEEGKAKVGWHIANYKNWYEAYCEVLEVDAMDFDIDEE